jgi:hypothetical protein
MFMIEMTLDGSSTTQARAGGATPLLPTPELSEELVNKRTPNRNLHEACEGPDIAPSEGPGCNTAMYG